ncbi:MAG TPA: DUF4350 domain-containing protein [Pyrinomonadaceae bacterium]|nr:DUF4350 domain-containing protein [Pyrinomonadaceae bacterium]
MKQKVLIFVALIFLVVVLVGLNAATYVQKERVPDTERAPNRSSYNFGSTGTHAFYSLLSETGRRVRRWQEPLDSIASDDDERPSVFVMIGPLRRELTDAESTKLMEWVSDGGTLVLIDRQPSSQLALTTAQWQMSITPNSNQELLGVDTTDQTQMTAQTPALKPSLPSAFTHGVNSVQPSRFASTITLERFNDSGEKRVEKIAGYETGSGSGGAPPPPAPPAVRLSPTPHDFYGGAQPYPPAKGSGNGENYAAETGADEDTAADNDNERASAFEAPLIHVGDTSRKILVEAPFASGRVVILSDPYIVSNAGINLVDNSRLAVNLVAGMGGVIAFDEYHHGHGANNNRLFQYFEGTPVMAIFLQCAIIVALVFFSQSRRFARPVPEPEPNRLSKLEYVSAMAELQQRTRAYDLAVENIYSDFRRRVCALLGLDNTTASRREIAERIGERIGVRVAEIEELLYHCEDVIHGEPIRKKDTIQVVERLRRLEEQLGLKRSGRKGV